MLFAPGAVTFSPPIPYSWQMSRMRNRLGRCTMKSIPFAAKLPRIARLSLALVTVAGTIGAVAQQTQRYTVVDLGLVGPPPGQPYAISGSGLVAGEIALANPTVAHAVLWQLGKRKDIGSPGLGGPNSSAFGANFWAGSRAGRHKDA